MLPHMVVKRLAHAALKPSLSLTAALSTARPAGICPEQSGDPTLPGKVSVSSPASQVPAVSPTPGPFCPDTARRPSAPVIGFHQRPLPPELIAFTSLLGRQVFKECLDAGTLENYFSLVGTFSPQADPAYCGLGSLAMVLNALEVDPGRSWKGIWRWYTDEMLECCGPLATIRERGITLDQFVRLSQCHGLIPDAYRHDQSSLESFEASLRKTATMGGLHMVVSFGREALGQTGIGHFSPIGAYNIQRRLALVLDVARFKYPPYWVSADRLWAAMKPIDGETGLPRGYIMLRRMTTRITGCP